MQQPTKLQKEGQKDFNMKKIGDGYWHYNGCDVYLAEHPKLSGKYEIYKGCDFIQRSYSLKEAKHVIIEKFGKISERKRINNLITLIAPKA